jgi:hypothetical protein
MLPMANPAVICERVADGAVLLHREEEIYFGLNAVAVRIWELLPPATGSLEELCGMLALEYPDVEPAELRGDVVELLEELADSGLVISAGVAGGSREDLAVPAL